MMSIFGHGNLKPSLESPRRARFSPPMPTSISRPRRREKLSDSKFQGLRMKVFGDLFVALKY